jgi:hypothetical protein
MKNSKCKCRICIKDQDLWFSHYDGFVFKTKQELIEHLENQLDEWSAVLDVVLSQLEDLGVNPYK